MAKYFQLWLTCDNQAEADKIARNLLVERLVTCVRQMPVTSDYRWQGKIEHEAEILLVMLSKESLFDSLEKEVTKLHSYGTFVLEATPITKLSKKAEEWFAEEIRGDG